MARSNTVTITVVPAKKKTTLTLTASKTTTYAGESVTLTAQLIETDTGIPVAGRSVYFFKEGGVFIDVKTTDSQGRCSTIISPGIAGTYSYYAEFTGDNEYEGCGEDADQQDNFLSW